MCAACVAQGVVYAGGALAGLQVMGARARAKRRGGDGDRPDPAQPPGPPEADSAEDDDRIGELA